MDGSILTLFLSVFAALFSVVNPLGAMPLFVTMTAGDSLSSRNHTAQRAAIYFVIILVVSFFLGTYILDFFGISISALRIAGGIIIFLSGFGLLRGDHAKSRAIDKKVQNEAVEKEDISLTPMAIPILAGPGSISLLIGYFHEFNDSDTIPWLKYLVIVGVVVLVGITVYLILRYSNILVSKLGESGMSSLSRIMGFIVMSVGIQFIINGTTAVIQVVYHSLKTV